MSDTVVLNVASLRIAMRQLVLGFGSRDKEATLVADNLVDANLMGHDSHGIGMLPRYVDAFVEGGLAPNAHVRTVLDAGALLRLDGQSGFGQVIGREAMAMGIERARSHGCAIVALGRSHHLGRIGAWAEQCCEAGFISLHFVNVVARPIVAPWGGARAGFGTNPFTAGVPLQGREPFILDFATSVVAQGKLRVAHNKGEALREGLLLDDQGRDTRDPKFAVLPPTGAILTFGQHKGYGLAVLSELLGGALAAGLTGHEEDGSKQRVLNGMFSIIVSPDAVGGGEDFAQSAISFAQSLLDAPTREGFDQVLLAGDPERATRRHREAHGVPVDGITWRQILEAAGKLGLNSAGIDAAARA